jgi:outer membrane lipoprotein-sorting protein
MKVRLMALAALLSLVVSPAFADARVEQWIAKARQALGGDAALNSLQSIHFTGTLETTQRVPVDPDNASGETREEALRLGIDIVFQKPYQQKMVLRSDTVIETTALDGYDAWVRRADATNESQWQLTLLDTQQVKRLRANTWENLNFYRGVEKRGGKVEYAGEANIDGRACIKLVFTHDPAIIFTRYFDQATGRLVKTETETGGEIREEGEILVGGLRFPKKLINKAPSGQVATITFDRITLNEKFPARDFEVPMLMPN